MMGNDGRPEEEWDGGPPKARARPPLFKKTFWGGGSSYFHYNTVVKVTILSSPFPPPLQDKISESSQQI